MSNASENCAVGPDGQLRDAKDIPWHNDVDDVLPILSSTSGTSLNLEQGRGKRLKKTGRLEASLTAQKQDDDGNPIAPKAQRRSVGNPKPARRVNQAQETDDDMDDDGVYIISSGTSEFEDDEVVMTNEELASVLPSKTVPLTAAGNSKKRKYVAGPATSSKKHHPAPSSDVGPEAPQTSSANTAASAPPPIKKKDSFSSLMDRKKNFVYLFYEPVTTDADGSVVPNAKYYKCFHGARATFKVTKGMRHSTKNMVNHLRSHFPAMHKLYHSFSNRNSLPTPFEIDIASASVPADSDEVTQHLKGLEIAREATIKAAFEKQVNASWDQAEFEGLLVEWMVSCDQPFEEVERPAFRALLDYVHMASRKPLRVPGRTTIKKCIMHMGEDSVAKTKEMFASLQSKRSISLDAWTSSNQYAFLAIVAHYVSNAGVLEELLIDFKELIGEHSGENMAATVWDTLQMYDITHKVMAFVMDNATNNDTMLVALERRFEEAQIPFSASDSRGRCVPHTIHLAAISLLEECGAISGADAEKAMSTVNYQDIATEVFHAGVEGDDFASKDDEKEDIESPVHVDGSAVGRLRKIVRAIRSSPQRRQGWARTVLISQLDSISPSRPVPLVPILDVRTRWSSTHTMIQRALMYRQSIHQFVESTRGLHPHELYESDWRDLEKICDWLSIFRAATTQMSSTKIPMLSTTHAIFRGLQDKLKEILRGLPDNVNSHVKTGILKSHRKLSDYFTKFDVSPYYTWAAILDPHITYEDLRSDYQEDEDLLNGLERSKADLYHHFDAFYAHVVSRPALPTSSSYNQPISRHSQSQDSPSFDFTARFHQKPQRHTLNELDEYLRLPAQEFYSCDPIQWWYAQRTRFPALSRLAFDILAIPGSAVAVEHVFSGGRNTISLRRASLRPETIRILMILKQSIRK
ncbi:hypothetical protein D9613_012957 [Agrocybe pediades]|uniref:HAT C-terminal dimerisation domain-containing protein n=1 Tax=Agrocybe pediades TaxID=84607 RepID=A0A8H4VPX0_9AGAR|nr:hypothetical protein D9613_012957 [Agrocybe pediades]